ncbi:hypothetical protein ABZP36_001249 [Zizania latifolia]
MPMPIDADSPSTPKNFASRHADSPSPPSVHPSCIPVNPCRQQLASRQGAKAIPQGVGEGARGRPRHHSATPLHAASLPRRHAPPHRHGATAPARRPPAELHVATLLNSRICSQQSHVQ